ncbi:unnamed protein product, partial [Iphiclides podalirius]
MCRTIQGILQSLICTLQMVTRIFMTFLLMIENMIRMLLQSLYNFISTLLQILSLIPICCVFLLTAKLKCLLCGGGGGGCGGGGGGGGVVGCFFSLLFFITFFQATQHFNLVDKMLMRAGYEKKNRMTTKVWNVSGYYRRAGEKQEFEMDDSTEAYADIDRETTTTTEIPLESFQPATEHSKAGNWSTILYYLL